LFLGLPKNVSNLVERDVILMACVDKRLVDKPYGGSRLHTMSLEQSSESEYWNSKPGLSRTTAWKPNSFRIGLTEDISDIRKALLDQAGYGAEEVKTPLHTREGWLECFKYKIEVPQGYAEVATVAGHLGAYD